MRGSSLWHGPQQSCESTGPRQSRPHCPCRTLFSEGLSTPPSSGLPHSFHGKVMKRLSEFRPSIKACRKRQRERSNKLRRGTLLSAIDMISHRSCPRGTLPSSLQCLQCVHSNMSTEASEIAHVCRDCLNAGMPTCVQEASQVLLGTTHTTASGIATESPHVFTCPHRQISQLVPIHSQGQRAEGRL